MSPIDGRVGRAIVTQGNLVSSGPGEATLHDHGGVARSDLRGLRRRRADLPSLWRAGAGCRAASVERRGCRSSWRCRATANFPHEGKLNFLDNQIDPGDRHDSRTRGVPKHRRQADAGSVRAAAAARRRHVSRHARAGPRRRHRPRQAVRLRRRPPIAPCSTARSRWARWSMACASSARVVAEGEQVVVNGLQRIRPGVKVQVETVAMDTRPTGATADAGRRRRRARWKVRRR